VEGQGRRSDLASNKPKVYALTYSPTTLAGTLASLPSADQEPEYSTPRFVSFAENGKQVVVGYLHPAIMYAASNDIQSTFTFIFSQQTVFYRAVSATTANGTWSRREAGESAW
jgi:hypothetical protein